MARVKISLDQNAMQRVRREMIAPIVEATAIIARNEIVKEMELAPARSGEFYPIPGTSMEYQASAPGEPPAIREGRYVASWKYTPAVVVGDTVVAFAYSDLTTEGGEHVIGELLEYGTKNMEPRPHIRPALARMEQAVEDYLR